MTYLEKFKQEHPGKILDHKGLPKLCPIAYGYETGCLCTKQTLTCEDCWTRQIPGTEINEREENNMETIPTTTTRKTKAELLKDIADLKKQVENLDKYKAYEECANQTYAVMESFMKAGFTREEAFKLTTELMLHSMRTAAL